jgi:putative transcriptional regulator
MADDFAPTPLANHFLIAMPSLHDEAFSRSVVYLCDHSERGAMGIVINKPSDILLDDMFDKVDLPLTRPELKGKLVLQGGPVHTDRGFVLHTPVRAVPVDLGDAPPEAVNEVGTTPTQGPPEDPSVFASTLVVPGGLEVTTSRDVLEAIANGSGPSKLLVSLGYASWGGGQLESELMENTWLTVEANSEWMNELIFDVPIDQRYTQALKFMGIDEWALSAVGGRA